MKYFSETTKKIYDSIEELEAAEKEAAAAKDARKAESEKVEKAYSAMKEAKKAYEVATEDYQKALSDFCDKYGSYKTTLRPGELFDLDPFWKIFNF
jgi:predicted  nucleic acid-binding Zn-ribbon protein